MVWLVFGSGLLTGIVVGVLLIEYLRIGADCRKDGKRPLDPHIW